MTTARSRSTGALPLLRSFTVRRNAGPATSPTPRALPRTALVRTTSTLIPVLSAVSVPSPARTGFGGFVMTGDGVGARVSTRVGTGAVGAAPEVAWALDDTAGDAPEEALIDALDDAWSPRVTSQTTSPTSTASATSPSKSGPRAAAGRRVSSSSTTCADPLCRTGHGPRAGRTTVAPAGRRHLLFRGDVRRWRVWGSPTRRGITHAGREAPLPHDTASARHLGPAVRLPAATRDPTAPSSSRGPPAARRGHASGRPDPTPRRPRRSGQHRHPRHPGSRPSDRQGHDRRAPEPSAGPAGRASPPPGSPDPAAQVEGATIRALTVVGTEGADHLDGRVSADVLTFIGPRNGARVIACEKVVYH